MAGHQGAKAGFRVGRKLGEGWARVGRRLGWARVGQGLGRAGRGLGMDWARVPRVGRKGWVKDGHGLGEGYKGDAGVSECEGGRRR